MEFFCIFFKKRLLTFRLVFFIGFDCVSAVDTWVSFATKLGFFFIFFSQNVTNISFFLFFRSFGFQFRWLSWVSFATKLLFFFLFSFHETSINVSFSFFRSLGFDSTAILSKFRKLLIFFLFLYETSTNVSFLIFLGPSVLILIGLAWVSFVSKLQHFFLRNVN